jgi:isocitrate lyase
VTLAGFHAVSHSMFELAHGYAADGMLAHARLQDHGAASTLALAESTEARQF